jgi:hypothetical protein
MGNKPKTRAVISVGKTLRELFSLYTRMAMAICKLFLGTKPHSSPIFKTDQFGRPVIEKVSTSNSIVEQHISFHRMLQSGRGRKIGRTLVLQDGRKLTHSVVVEGFNSESIFPAFLRFYGKVSMKQYDHAPRNKDRVVNLGRTNGATDAPLICVLAAGKTFDPSKLVWGEASIKVLEFGHFNLIVLSTRIEFPGLNFGRTAFPISAPPRLNWADTLNIPIKSRISMSHAQVVKFLDDTCHRLMKSVMEAVYARNFPNLVFEVKDSLSFPRLPMLPIELEMDGV